MAACEIANSRVFIESDELKYAVTDDVQSLKLAMESDVYKAPLIEQMGLTKYNQDYETIKLLAIKEAKES